MIKSVKKITLKNKVNTAKKNLSLAKYSFQGKEWYNFIKRNYQTFINDSQDALYNSREIGYLDINGHLSPRVVGNQNGVNTMQTLNKNACSLDVFGEIHFHTLLNGKGDNPYSLGDVNGLFATIKNLNGFPKPNAPNWFDIAYTQNYIYIMEIIDIDMASAIDYENIFNSIKNDVYSTQTDWHDVHLKAYKRYLSGTGIVMYLYSFSQQKFIQIF